MRDTVERLRKWALFSVGIGAMDSERVMLEAADEIERLWTVVDAAQNLLSANDGTRSEAATEMLNALADVEKPQRKTEGA